MKCPFLGMTADRIMSSSINADIQAAVISHAKRLDFRYVQERDGFGAC